MSILPRLIPAVAALAALPAHAHETGVPHLSHELEPWLIVGAAVALLLGVRALLRHLVRSR
jgi:hypothetical protein